MARFALVVSFLLFAAAKYTEEGGVIVGTDQNLKELIESNQFVVVDYYAPWCAHCKALEPQYQQAVTLLKGSVSKVKIVKLDATVHKRSAAQAKLKYYPTIILHNRSRMRVYEGDNTADSIKQWVQKNTISSVKLLPNFLLLDKFKQTVQVVVALFADHGSEEYNLLEYVSKDFLNLAHVVISSEGALQLYDVQKPSLIIFKQLDEKEVLFNQKFTEKNLKKFIEKNMVPWLIPIDSWVIEEIYRGQRSGIFYFRSEPVHDELFKNLGKESQGKFIITTVDLNEETLKMVGEHFGMTKENMPAVFFFDHESGENYRMEYDIDETSIREFINEWRPGTFKIEGVEIVDNQKDDL